jgi:hypothetical protein
VQWRLNNNLVVDLWIKRFEDYIELPSTATALVNDKLDLSFKWSEWLESKVEHKRFIGTCQVSSSLFNIDRAVYKSLMGLLHNFEFVVECIFEVDQLEARQNDFD